MVILVLALCTIILSSEAFRMPMAADRIARRDSLSSILKMAHYPNAPNSLKPGVITGKAVTDLLEFAKEKKFAIPGVSVVGTNSIKACLEAAKKYNGPMIITFTKAGGKFIAGGAADNTNEVAAVAGCVAAAKHVREVARLYGVPIMLHTDHCSKESLAWMDGLLEADERHFKVHGEPLFSSHMIDLSEEPLQENIATCKKYMERMAKLNILLEFELGVTGGGTEDTAPHSTGVDSSLLYTQPEEVLYAYEQLSQVPNAAFTCAASFGNVHGVYAPGNVKLEPVILYNTQKYMSEKLGTNDEKPIKFVFHGGSGSSVEDVHSAIDAGVVKVNIDTDTQWAFWDGMREYGLANDDFKQPKSNNHHHHQQQQQQVEEGGGMGGGESGEGGRDGKKARFDPTAPLEKGEEKMTARLLKVAEDLRCFNVL